MKVPLRHETNFSCSNRSALWQHEYFEERFLFREILHLARGTIKSTSFSTVDE